MQAWVRRQGPALAALRQRALGPWIAALAGGQPDAVARLRRLAGVPGVGALAAGEVLRALAARDPAAAIARGEQLVADGVGWGVALVLAQLHARAGGIRRPSALLAQVPAALRPRRLEAQLRSDLALLDAPAASPVVGARAASASRRILYHAAQSLPHHSSGYAIRTHWLVRALRGHAWDVEVQTRAGYPLDRADRSAADPTLRTAEVDGVPYHFAPDAALRGALHADVQRATVAALVAQAQRQRPALIHAASNYVVGLAGVEAARQLGLPSVYEVRGLWHLTRAAGQPAFATSDQYELTERLEAEVARRADRVLVITRAVGDHLAARGVPWAKMAVLPNAVDPAAFAPRPPTPALLERLGLGGVAVIGYIGSLVHYEGLDVLLVAAAQLRARLGGAFRVLIVGDGAALPGLRAQARALGIEDLVVFTGRVPHHEVGDYYAAVDVLAFPRKDLPVCHLVSPLKPFEAMAMGKAVVVSDVAALTEIVVDGETGWVHRRDDAGSLADTLAACLADPPRRAAIAAAGQAWVRAHRSWHDVSLTIDRTYRELLGRD